MVWWGHARGERGAMGLTHWVPCPLSPCDSGNPYKPHALSHSKIG